MHFPKALLRNTRALLLGTSASCSPHMKLLASFIKQSIQKKPPCFNMQRVLAHFVDDDTVQHLIQTWKLERKPRVQFFRLLQEQQMKFNKLSLSK